MFARVEAARLSTTTMIDTANLRVIRSLVLGKRLRVVPAFFPKSLKKDSPKKSKAKSGGSRIVDPLEAVERSLADSKSKLKGETTKKLKVKKKTVDAQTQELYTNYEGETGKKAFWNGKETNGYLEWRQATA